MERLAPSAVLHVSRPIFRRRAAAALLAGSLAVLAAIAAALPPAAAAANWPEFNIDGRHNGNNQEEIVINAANVSTLHTLYSVTLPSVADGAPAFQSGVQTGSGTIDMLFLTTKDGRILALNATSGATVWSHQPATGPNYTTSSPAVDPNGQYVYSYALDGKVHKYQIADGTEITTGGWPELTTNKPSVEKGSGAVSIAVTNSGTVYLYMNNGGYPGDQGDYQGHVTAIDLATGAQNVFNTLCSNQTVHFVISPGTPDCSFVQSAVWARPGVVYSSETNHILFATGNGTFDANTGGHEFGDTVLATNPDGTGSGGLPIDSYTPVNFQALDDGDVDLGSTAPALLPPVPSSKAPYMAVQSGKDAELRLIDLANLSGSGGPGHTGGELQIVSVPQGNEVLTQPAVWTDPATGGIWVFVANDSGISGLSLAVDGSGNPSLNEQWMNSTGGTSPVIADGILYYASTSGVMALDPKTGTQLYSDSSIGGLHWESPIVVSGRLYVTDENAKLWAYGPAPSASGFYTIAPCRVIDTRQAAGTYGGPGLQPNGARRLFPIAGQCGIPSDARAVAANVTVVTPSAVGDFRVGPAGVIDLTSTINFASGQVRAGNTVVSLTGNPLGAIWVQSDVAAPTNLILDVSGYFK
jgi:hypothetical protein